MSTSTATAGAAAAGTAPLVPSDTKFEHATERPFGTDAHVLIEVPEKRFYKACKLCQFMKMITLEGTQRSLERMEYEVVLDEEVRVGAERSLRRMFELGV